jgi:hypothetical protein
MGTYGKSFPAPTTTTTAEDTAANTASIEALADGLKHTRRKVAMHVDGFVEPDDIRVDDALKNLERSDE